MLHRNHEQSAINSILLFWVLLLNGTETDWIRRTLETRSCQNQIKRGKCPHTTRLNTTLAPKNTSYHTTCLVGQYHESSCAYFPHTSGVASLWPGAD